MYFIYTSPQKLPTVKAAETVVQEVAHAAEISWGIKICITPDPYHYTGNDTYNTIIHALVMISNVLLQMVIPLKKKYWYLKYVK